MDDKENWSVARNAVDLLNTMKFEPSEGDDSTQLQESRISFEESPLGSPQIGRYLEKMPDSSPSVSSSLKKNYQGNISICVQDDIDSAHGLQPHASDVDDLSIATNLVLTIDIGGGRSDTIQVSDVDSISSDVRRFIGRNNLDSKLMPVLMQYVLSQWIATTTESVQQPIDDDSDNDNISDEAHSQPDTSSGHSPTTRISSPQSSNTKHQENPRREKKVQFAREGPLEARSDNSFGKDGTRLQPTEYALTECAVQDGARGARTDVDTSNSDENSYYYQHFQKRQAHLFQEQKRHTTVRQHHGRRRNTKKPRRARNTEELRSEQALPKREKVTVGLEHNHRASETTGMSTLRPTNVFDRLYCKGTATCVGGSLRAPSGIGADGAAHASLSGSTQSEAEHQKSKLETDQPDSTSNSKQVSDSMDPQSRLPPPLSDEDDDDDGRRCPTQNHGEGDVCGADFSGKVQSEVSTDKSEPANLRNSQSTIRRTKLELLNQRFYSNAVGKKQALTVQREKQRQLLEMRRESNWSCPKCSSFNKPDTGNPTMLSLHRLLIQCNL